MTHDDLKDHEKRYMEARTKKQEEHASKVKEARQVSHDATKRFKTRAYERVIQAEQDERDRREELAESKKNLLEKKQMYGHYVRQSFLPEISREKEAQRQQLIEGLKHPVREAVKVSPGTHVDIPPPNEDDPPRSRSRAASRGGQSEAAKNEKIS